MANHKKNFTDKVVVVTGASMGIGRDTALAFARRGAKVALASRKADLLQSVAQEIHRLGSQALVIPTDVTERRQVDNLVQTALQHFGRIDILVNNAGAGLHGAAVELTDTVVEETFKLNFFGCLYAIQAVYPHMKERQSGQIINVSSIVGLRAIPTVSGYCASKHALQGLSDALRIEAKLDNIDIINVCPAITLTDFRKNQKVIGHQHQHPQWFAMKSEDVAQAIIDASIKRKREVVLTLSARMMLKVNAFFPSFIDWILLSGYKKELRQIKN